MNVSAIMTEEQFRSMFPKASKSFLDANKQSGGQPAPNAVQVNVAPKRGHSMTNAELEYAMILEAMKRRGEIESYKFEGVTLKLADGCRFTPDFFIVVSSLVLRLRFCEIKGRHIWDDALVKFKVARDQNPWAEWQLHQKTRSEWKRLL